MPYPKVFSRKCSINQVFLTEHHRVRFCVNFPLELCYAFTESWPGSGTNRIPLTILTSFILLEIRRFGPIWINKRTNGTTYMFFFNYIMLSCNVYLQWQRSLLKQEISIQGTPTPCVSAQPPSVFVRLPRVSTIHW